VDEFDEQDGIHYDGDYSAANISQGLLLILPIPNTLGLHPRNRIQGYSDPSFGMWKHVKAALEKKYGDRPGGHWRDKECLG
jgi:hypothetical protein